MTQGEAPACMRPRGQDAHRCARGESRHGGRVPIDALYEIRVRRGARVAEERRATRGGVAPHGIPKQMTQRGRGRGHDVALTERDARVAFELARRVERLECGDFSWVGAGCRSGLGGLESESGALSNLVE